MGYHFDYETTSECDIGDCGGFRYAFDPSTRVLMFAIAKEDMRPLVWDSMDPDGRESRAAAALYEEMVNDTAPIYAHNVQFEVAVTEWVMPRCGFRGKISTDRWRCTATMCRRAGLPPSLGDAAKFLDIEQKKDVRGDILIKVFSDQNHAIKLRKGKEKMKTFSPLLEVEVPWDWTFTFNGNQVSVADAWQMMIEYCRQDVVVERELHKVLGVFELQGDLLEGFLFDLRMNIRGIPVDVPALKRARKLIKDYEIQLAKRFKELTGLGPKQNVALLKWFRARGYPGDNLQKETVTGILEMEGEDSPAANMTALCREALEVRGYLTFAAVAKVSKMLDWVCPDGKIRGAFIFYGAQKTGRWTSTGPQFQNMKKPPKWMKPMMARIYAAVAEWAENEDLQFFYGNPYEVLACCARYFVREEEQIFDVDFAQVEARILPALICAERILDKFRRGEDIYVEVAEALGTDRDMGKIISLLCQFGGGWKAINLPHLSEREKRRAVAIYRKNNPEVKQGWSDCQDAFVEAYKNPGKWINATPHIKFGFNRKAPYPRMLMRLPSGRDIVYPFPKIHPITMYQKRKTRVTLNEETREYLVEEGAAEWKRTPGHVDLPEYYFFHTYELSFFGHVEGKHYGRVKTYGGDLLQSATQGTGMDFLMHGCVVAERRGFEPFLVVHDQALARKHPAGLQAFIDALCTRPRWFPDFPLEADGNLADSYSKD